MFARLMGLSTISPRELHTAIQNNTHDTSLKIVDVNARQSWLKARVPGAFNIDPTHYTENDLAGDSNAMLVFYCSNPMCRKAPLAARRAKALGYRNVHVMSAGISGWLSAKLPVESGE